MIHQSNAEQALLKYVFFEHHSLKKPKVLSFLFKNISHREVLDLFTMSSLKQKSNKEKRHVRICIF